MTAVFLHSALPCPTGTLEGMGQQYLDVQSCSHWPPLLSLQWMDGKRRFGSTQTTGGDFPPFSEMASLCWPNKKGRENSKWIQ